MTLYIYRVGRSCPARKSFYKSGLESGHRSDRCTRYADLAEVISPSSGLRFGRSTYESSSTWRDLSNDECPNYILWTLTTPIWPVRLDLPILGANNTDMCMITKQKQDDPERSTNIVRAESRRGGVRRFVLGSAGQLWRLQTSRRWRDNNIVDWKSRKKR
jgi:hypothetical protein